MELQVVRFEMVDSEIKSLILSLPRLNDHMVSLDDGGVSEIDEYLNHL